MKFQVRVKAKPGEVVFVVGDGPELGNWKHKAAVQLDVLEDSANDHG